MNDEMFLVLTRFHREVFLPDFQRILDDAVEKSARSLRKEKSEYYGLKSWASYLDERLARVETEVQSMNGADIAYVESELQFVRSHLRALEMLVTDIEKKIERLATESELIEIRQQIVKLNDRISALETRH
jgi:predicted  nucleic acid-binding Zn-ribbon protein